MALVSLARYHTTPSPLFKIYIVRNVFQKESRIFLTANKNFDLNKMVSKWSSVNQTRLLSSHIIQKIQLPVKNGGNLWTCKIMKRRKSKILKLSNNRKLITKKDILWILIFRYYDSIFDSGSDYSSDHGPPLAPPEVRFVTLKRSWIKPAQLIIFFSHDRNIKFLISILF